MDAYQDLAASYDRLTNDVDGLYERALAHGAGSLVEPKDAVLELTEPVKARLAFVTGINGEEIELFYIYEA